MWRVSKSADPDQTLRLWLVWVYTFLHMSEGPFSHDAGHIATDKDVFR